MASHGEMESSVQDVLISVLLPNNTVREQLIRMDKTVRQVTATILRKSNISFLETHTRMVLRRPDQSQRVLEMDRHFIDYASALTEGGVSLEITN